MGLEWKKDKGKVEPGGLNHISRRQFLSYATLGLGAIISALIATPLVGSLVSPLVQKKKAEAEWRELGKIEDFKAGKPKIVQWTTAKLEGGVMETAPRAVWVIKKDDDDFTVFNSRCTHLNCAYSWKLKGESHQTAYGSAMPDKDHFFCPCHDGIFDLDGAVLGGPPPRPLDTLPVKIDDGRLFTSYRDFRAGIPEKVEI
ncbi:MAG: ubiquinol-cytochrome c reductase iron-sulfur subunit [Chloroflexi bacterium]|nr:ubiquinol-cytochrome c reductase iron-sulfur subunit [Chloroflexota bacterium]